jgi:hypothetical protein
VRALEITAKFATRLGHSDDATRYSTLATAARALYKSTFFNATTACYAACTYVSQVLALTLGLSGPQGSPEEAAVWAHAMDWWSANATQGVPEHFGGGIISLKYAYPLLDAHGETGLALKMHLQADKAPGFGYWIETGGATTLWESYDMTATEGTNSRNHIMFGAAGSWYYTTLAGLGRAQGSRSWLDLVLTPPSSPALLSQLSYAGASIDTTMGRVASSWVTPPRPAQGDVCGSVGEHANLTFTCHSPQPGATATFTGVAFASFGAPTGNCSSGWALNTSCHAPTSMDTVKRACVGQSTCTIPATVDYFGGVDPCPMVLKHLAVALEGECSGVSFTYSITIPTGSTATVVVPTMGVAPGGVIMEEGGVVVWSKGAFAPGVPGVPAAAPGGDGASVVFSGVGSGSYVFTVFSA